ncbi:hypothetical protein M758_3G081000 [Ceratodon purpureus]|uniref:Uncharacterized protein n=1 Tax=Ceratodon purpureus TaxID=3225 RepID=A0A8T0IIL8_CERPU|nr:hypothetical protein KC19_3G079800 [Ceratodon purpureus]KAG0622218.1 hypothetical protein M758_3G081000 [Ceratodon purpureus]
MPRSSASISTNTSRFNKARALLESTTAYEVPMFRIHWATVWLTGWAEDLSHVCKSAWGGASLYDLTGRKAGSMVTRDIPILQAT